METKNIVATIYLKDGLAVKSRTDDTPVADDIYELCQRYNDNGIDKIMIMDLSEDEDEHDKNIQIIKNINRVVDIKVCAGGNIHKIEDIKRLLYAGCIQVILNGSKRNAMLLANEASKKFGKDRILVSIKNVDFIFKNQKALETTFHEVLLLTPDLLDALENITSTPHIVMFSEFDYEEALEVLRREHVRGIAGGIIDDSSTDIMALKCQLSDDGVRMDNFFSELKWSDLKLNSDGMVPVIVQDYRTDEVLMLAYMNEEAFNTTIRIGKMTYYSRSRNELWTKGLTSGHLQYVKSLEADCDFDTILAKVAQVGVACHTGRRSCFFNPIVKKEYMERNPLKVLEQAYENIKACKDNPKEGSYTNYLFDKGIDKMLKKLGEECTKLIISAKGPDSENIKYNLSDFLFHSMVLMVEKGVTWEDIMNELSQK